jgi:hypothetical protein
MRDYYQDQPLLEAEAYGILRELALMDLLAMYGRPYLVGSVPLRTIVKLDIDLNVVLEQGLFTSCLAITQALFFQRRIADIRWTNLLYQQALKLSLDRYPAPSGDWSIDMIITPNSATEALVHLEWVAERLSEETRQAILAIKAHYYHRGEYCRGLGYRIYQAVLDQGVRNVDEFKRLVPRKLP